MGSGSFGKVSGRVAGQWTPEPQQRRRAGDGAGHPDAAEGVAREEELHDGLEVEAAAAPDGAAAAEPAHGLTDLADLPHLPSLTTLELTSSRNFTHAGLRTLKSAAQLERLNLFSSGIRPVDYGATRAVIREHFPSLQELTWPSGRVEQFTPASRAGGGNGEQDEPAVQSLEED